MHRHTRLISHHRLLAPRSPDRHSEHCVTCATAGPSLWSPCTLPSHTLPCQKLTCLIGPCRRCTFPSGTSSNLSSDSCTAQTSFIIPDLCAGAAAEYLGPALLHLSGGDWPDAHAAVRADRLVRSSAQRHRLQRGVCIHRWVRMHTKGPHIDGKRCDGHVSRRTLSRNLVLLCPCSPWGQVGERKRDRSREGGKVVVKLQRLQRKVLQQSLKTEVKGSRATRLGSVDPLTNIL